MVQQMCCTGYSPKTVGMPFGASLTRYMESKCIPSFANDTYVEVKKKINAQTLNQSEAHLFRDHIVPRPVYVDETLTMGERMENLEPAVIGGFENVAQEFNTMNQSMQQMELASVQSSAQMTEMLE